MLVIGGVKQTGHRNYNSHRYVHLGPGMRPPRCTCEHVRVCSSKVHPYRFRIYVHIKLKSNRGRAVCPTSFPFPRKPGHCGRDHVLAPRLGDTQCYAQWTKVKNPKYLIHKLLYFKMLIMERRFQCYPLLLLNLLICCRK